MNEEIIQNLNDRLDMAIERGRDMLADEDLNERIAEFKETAEETIRKNPIKSVVIGLAVGFLVGKVISGD